MKKTSYLILTLVLAASLAFVTAQEDIGPKVTLDVPQKKQETKMWCWAACVQMIMEYMGEPVTQCEQANARMSRSDCCGEPAPAVCVRGGWPQLFRYGVSNDSVEAALSWEDLKAQLDSNQPVLFSWRWKLGGGHMMLAVGYAEPHWVFVNNPWPPHGDAELPEGDFQIMTYQEYVSGDNHDHWRDYYNITKKEEPELTEAPSPEATAHAEIEISAVTASTTEETAEQTPEFVAFDTKPEPIGGFRAIQQALVYPRGAREAGKKGRVVLNVLVSKEGEVTNTKILQSSGFADLDEAARTAVESIRWRPAKQREEPVDVWVAIPINFKIR